MKIKIINGPNINMLGIREPGIYGADNFKTLIKNIKAFAKENKIRITFDNNIVATETNFDLFSENLVMYPVLDKFNVVLEVKFNGFLLDYIRQFINSINKSELSVSKYALARQQSYDEI